MNLLTVETTVPSKTSSGSRIFTAPAKTVVPPTQRGHGFEVDPSRRGAPRRPGDAVIRMLRLPIPRLSRSCAYRDCHVIVAQVPSHAIVPGRPREARLPCYHPRE